MVATTVTRNRTPRFPTPPTSRPSSILSMPEDLIADGRNYYTEVFFLDFRTAKYGVGSNAASFLNNSLADNSALAGTVGGVAGGAVGAIAGAVRAGPMGAIVGGVAGAAGGAGIGALLGNSGGAVSSSALRLPIPNKINDTITLNWGPSSAKELINSLSPGLSQTIDLVNKAGAFAGKAVNPLLFLTFNHQDFREFSFDWVLAPKNKQESNNVKRIVGLFKNASLPSKGFIMDYPLIAIVRMSPNNLDNLAIFKPMAIISVTANYTANPTPSFFEDTGAPTIVTLSVRFKEIELWYRDERGIV